MKKLPYMNKPCAHCPFRKDSTKGWLGKNRATEIAEADSFVCHKTTGGSLSSRKQCAGHMLLLQEQNSFLRTMKGFGIPYKLEGNELIFDNILEFTNHHNYVNKRNNRS
jgi:hypothetical protein